MKHLSVLLMLLSLGSGARAQQPVTRGPVDLRVYLDCPHLCDGDFIGTEINYVNWVREPADAQVHVIVSRLSTGSGGGEYTFTFTGRKKSEARADTLRYVSPMTDSPDQLRRGITHALQVGLVPFLVRAGALERLQVLWRANDATTGENAAEPPADPWDFWIFSVGGRLNLDGEESQHFSRLNGNVSANRTTEELKVRLGFSGSYNESSFTYDDGDGDTTVVSIRKDYSINGIVVKSIGGHFSAGMQGHLGSGTYGNVTLGVSGGPAIEFSFWPYSQVTRRSLLFRYALGVDSYDYRELTIYGKTAETHPSHELTGELDVRQPFGSVDLQVELSQYLHDTSFYSASVRTGANVKLFKGLSLDLSGNYQLVRDQLSLPATDLTPEEVLLQQRQLKTGFRYRGALGLRYSFGSIFNNVVNPRFD